MEVIWKGKSEYLMLTHGKAYKVLSVEKGWYRLIDDSGEDYLYPPEGFEELWRENDNIDWKKINEYRKLPKEELERLIAEKEKEIMAEFENTKEVKEIIDDITRTNAFVPADNPDSSGLSPDLTDEDIAGLIERGTSMRCEYRYYFDEENCILYKSVYEGSLEEYIEGRLWNAVSYEALIDSLVEVTEEEADDIIKEIEGDEYDLVDGYALEDYSGEV